MSKIILQTIKKFPLLRILISIIFLWVVLWGVDHFTDNSQFNLKQLVPQDNSVVNCISIGIFFIYFIVSILNTIHIFRNTSSKKKLDFNTIILQFDYLLVTLAIMILTLKSFVEMSEVFIFVFISITIGRELDELLLSILRFVGKNKDVIKRKELDDVLFMKERAEYLDTCMYSRHETTNLSESNKVTAENDYFDLCENLVTNKDDKSI